MKVSEFHSPQPPVITRISLPLRIPGEGYTRDRITFYLPEWFIPHVLDMSIGGLYRLAKECKADPEREKKLAGPIKQRVGNWRQMWVHASGQIRSDWLISEIKEGLEAAFQIHPSVLYPTQKRNKHRVDPAGSTRGFHDNAEKASKNPWWTDIPTASHYLAYNLIRNPKVIDYIHRLVYDTQNTTPLHVHQRKLAQLADQRALTLSRLNKARAKYGLEDHDPIRTDFKDWDDYRSHVEKKKP